MSAFGCGLRVGALMIGASACGGAPAPAEGAREALPLAADVPELEIRTQGVDRFTTCPPPGELGQHWIPTIPPWTPSSAMADAGSADEGVAPSPIARTNDRTVTELAVDATHRDFRSCYRQGLVRHPTQDGRVAVVLRINAGGRVEKVESFGACELDPESVSCMYGVARKLRFPPPTGGSATVTIPATFTSRDGVRRTVPTPNDAYTAATYVTLDAARPQLHACDEAARHDGRSAQAHGVFTMDIAPDGHVLATHIDPSSGDRTLLQCAGSALQRLAFPPPPVEPGARHAKVIARLNFNPRQGTR